MRVTKTASAVAALALSGSLALGSAGTAFAAGVPVGERTTTATGSEAEKTVTAEQFRVVERLGALANLTGALGRIAQDSKANPQLLKSLQRQTKAQTREVQQAVEQSRAKTRPVIAQQNRQVPRLADAVEKFEASAEAVVSSDRSNSEARAKASAVLLADLATVSRAATAEAGIPEQAVAPQQSESLPPGGRARADRAASVPAPETGGLAARAESLSGINGVLTPVTGLLTDVMEADGGKLSPDRIAEHSRAVKKALAPAQRVGSRSSDADSRAAEAAGERATAAATLQTKADALLKASGAGNAGKTRAAADETVRATLEFLGRSLAENRLSDGNASEAHRPGELPKVPAVEN